MNSVVVRFPPSPTGHLHIGTVRTCLYNYLFAKGRGGRIIFRSENTDRIRSEQRYEDEIVNGLKDLGITWDEGPISQYDRRDYHREVIDKLLASGAAYRCFATTEELDAERERQRAAKLPPRYEGCGKRSPEEEQQLLADGAPYSVRLNTNLPDRGDITWNDLVRGDIRVSIHEVDDFVLMKSDGSPLYNLAVVADDHDMGVTHVLRGEDHISNTPKQILIYEAMDWDLPEFGHFPLILNADKSKLSKRKNDVNAQSYLDAGIPKEALLNYLALLGWNTADEKEIFSLQELIETFSLERVQKGGAIWDIQRLMWVSGSHIRQMNAGQLREQMDPYLTDVVRDYLDQLGQERMFMVLDLVQPRARTLVDMNDMIAPYAADDSSWFVDPEMLTHNKLKVTPELALSGLQICQQVLMAVTDEEWNIGHLEQQLVNAASENEVKNGALLWPLRSAMTNAPMSPGVFDILVLLGRQRSLIRLERVLAQIT